MSHGEVGADPRAGAGADRSDSARSDSARCIRVTIRRFHPNRDAGSFEQTYTVELDEPHSVLGVLDRIWSEQDPTLAYHSSCRRGFCSICTLKVNGKTVKTCLELADGDLHLEAPGRPEKVIRDLAFRW